MSEVGIGAIGHTDIFGRFANRIDAVKIVINGFGLDVS